MRIVVVGIVAFLAGAFAVVVSGVGRRQPVVQVHLMNRTSRAIASIKIRDSHGIALVEDIPAQALRHTEVYCPDEDSIMLEVHFSDGEVLKEMAGYVEAGYSVTAKVGQGKIEVETKL